ncbi:MAG: carbohydrate porin [Acidobacteria bacterium]|nr:carbohydrate porin [Acidobacteriota bacterium]
MKRQVVAASLGVAALLSGAAGARGQGAGRPTSAVQPAYQTLVEHGFRPALIYDAEGFADLSGGARRGATYLGNLNLLLTLDMERLANWRGATVFLDGLAIHGGRPSRFAGDAQGVSSIEAAQEWTLEEAWIQQNLFSNRFSALVGLYDVNSEFYHLHAADLFLNASFGMGPELSQSGKGGPSVFPHTAVGARFEVKPLAGVVLRGAVLDGVPVERPTGRDVFAKADGLFIVSEAAFLYRPTPPERPQRPHRFLLGREAQLPPYEAKLAVGMWHYTASFDDLVRTRGNGTPLTHQGSSGAYVIGDAIVYENELGRRLRVFGQIGLGDSRVNRFGFYTGGGVDLAGWIPGRKQDEIGFGMAAAHNGSPFIEQRRQTGQRVDRSELTLELAYRSRINSWLNIQPDLQYVFNPNTDPRVANALVCLLRIEVAF